MRCIYLHGFCSGPSSSKAKFFRQKLSADNLDVVVPDLNVPDFEHLKLSAQLELVSTLLAGSVEETILVGSSMGGLVATLSHLSAPQVKAMVLLAPGFGILRRWDSLWTIEQLLSWKETGWTEVFHYGSNGMKRLNYEFVLDAENIQTEGLPCKVPTLIVHGKKDTVVPLSESKIFQRANPSLVRLAELDSDHQLLDVLDQTWALSREFLKSI